MKCRDRLRLILLFILFVGYTFQNACADKIKVVVTFSIIGDIVKNVGGDQVALSVLVGANGDAHEYEPTPQDVVLLAKADLVVENGLHLEHWLDKIYVASGTHAKRIVAASGIVTRIMPNDPQEVDPHAWQNVDNVITYARNVEHALQNINPSNRKAYQENADHYILQLKALDQWIMSQVKTIKNPTIVTNHDALGYFADRYGFHVVGAVIPSATTEAGDPSAKQSAALLDTIKRTKVEVVFAENSANAKLASSLASEAGIVLAPELYTDALGLENSDGADYIGMMRHNVNIFVKYLSRP